MSKSEPTTPTDHIVALCKSGEAPVILSAQDVTLLGVNLPIRGARKRRAALPFALEERIATPLDKVQVVLGPSANTENADHVLALIVSNDVMAASDTDRPVYCETLAIAPPEVGSNIWAVFEQVGRVIVRLSDGTGFGADSSAFPTLWNAAGRPEVQLLGGALPQGIAFSKVAYVPPPARDVLVDLRQGRFLPKTSDSFWPLRGLAKIAAFVLLAHLALSAIDLYALRSLVQQERARAQAVITPLLPRVTVTPEVSVFANRLRPEAITLKRSGFVPLMTRVSNVIGDGATVRRMSYGSSDNTLIILMEAPSLAALQTIETRLNSAGLKTQAGAASALNGAAEVQMRIIGEGT